MPRAAVPIASSRLLQSAERSQLAQMLGHYKSVRDEQLRRAIIENDRIDLLCTHVLGLTLKPFHRRILRFQFQHPNNLQLVYRGAGKTSIATIAKAIHLLIKNRNLRIVFLSKTTTNASAFLREVKGHLEHNRRLIELFGEFYDPRRVGKWDETEIEILGRTVHPKEASITCVGFESAVVSRHYDVEFCDDLITEENSRTKNMRDRTQTWYYQTFDPTMEPPDPDVPHRGERHRLGTPYHYDDIYGHWIKNELREHHQIIPAIDAQGNVPWPEKHSREWFEEKRANAGTIIFAAQYLCNTEAMQGEIFQYDQCQRIDESEVPKSLPRYMGVDLAIGEKDENDHFAMVAADVDPKTDFIYVRDAYDGQLRFSAQTSKILEYNRRHNPVRVGIETNAYQKAQYQQLEDSGKRILLKAIETDKDKITRAHRLQPRFEKGQVFFVSRGGRLSPALNALVDQLVMFPAHRYKDMFDAFDHMVTASKIRNKKRREGKVGLL